MFKYYYFIKNIKIMLLESFFAINKFLVILLNKQYKINQLKIEFALIKRYLPKYRHYIHIPYPFSIIYDEYLPFPYLKKNKELYNKFFSNKKFIYNYFTLYVKKEKINELIFSFYFTYKIIFNNKITEKYDLIKRYINKRLPKVERKVVFSFYKSENPPLPEEKPKIDLIINIFYNFFITIFFNFKKYSNKNYFFFVLTTLFILSKEFIPANEEIILFLIISIFLYLNYNLVIIVIKIFFYDFSIFILYYFATQNKNLILTIVGFATARKLQYNWTIWYIAWSLVDLLKFFKKLEHFTLVNCRKKLHKSNIKTQLTVILNSQLNFFKYTYNYAIKIINKI